MLTTSSTDCDLAFGQPLLDSHDRAATYSDNQFTMLAVVRTVVHLAP